MRLTLISDASFCPDTKAAGYGGWIACDRGREACIGPIRGAPNSGAAETMAICNVVWEAFNRKLVVAGDHLIIQTDCATAIKVYEEARWTTEQEGSAFKWLNDHIKLFSLTVEFRHVKGHSNVQDTRSKAQRFCDERAREAMKKERSKIRLKECKEVINADRAKRNLKPIKTSNMSNKEKNKLQAKARLARRSYTMGNDTHSDYTMGDDNGYLNG